MVPPRAPALFLIAAGVFLMLPSLLGETFQIAGGVCLVLAGVLGMNR